MSVSGAAAGGAEGFEPLTCTPRAITHRRCVLQHGGVRGALGARNDAKRQKMTRTVVAQLHTESPVMDVVSGRFTAVEYSQRFRADTLCAALSRR